VYIYMYEGAFLCTYICISFTSSLIEGFYSFLCIYILPLFGNIRCFSFVNGMYLDIF
jgi:hypothetical protein